MWIVGGTSLKTSSKPTGATNTQTDTQLWALHNCTPGSTAATAIFVWTGINWQGDFEKYIKYVQSRLDKHKASVLNIFCEWDDLFFPDSDSSLAHKVDDDASGECQMQDVMALLDADEEEVQTNPEVDG
ncbi:hypothetical protein C8R44DRAFT_736789 [Mycena epipterygia]|nr:hypothetical protein C8R44DRAFT_736789 [Mycena epipterygia]